MHWIDLIRQRLSANLARLPLPEKLRAAILAEEMSKAVADTEAGRPFGAAPRQGDPDWTPDMAVPAAPDEEDGAENSADILRKLRVDSLDKQREEILQKQAADDPLTSRGERMSSLRARARKEWEPWT